MLNLPVVTYGSRYDPAQQARELFSALLRLDAMGVKFVYAQRPSPKGVGLAVYNRLLRAAAFQVETAPGPMVVGLVGPSGAGKSTVGRELAGLGYGVLDCDRFSRSEKVYDRECIAQLQEAFGQEVAPGGVLDRKTLAARAFAGPEAKKALEAITLPRIVRAVRQEAEGMLRTGKPVVLDAPTLFEAGLDSMCRRIIAVTAPEEERLRRIMERDGLGEAQGRQRLQAQPPAGFYTSRADYVIVNGPGADVLAQVRELAEELKGG